MTQTLDRRPGLYVSTPDQQPLAFPLQHTDVQANVAGNVARVEVTQRFENPFTTALEAVYIFPLPDEAAVDELLIQIGDRTIRGSIKPRQEAQHIYQQAKQQGQTAGLLEQERDNIFTQSLANIKPGEQVDVVIRYTESLKFAAGDYEWVFPMVVGPRYIPGTPIEAVACDRGSAPAPMTQNQDTNLVPDASRLNAPIVPIGLRSSHDIQVTVEIDAGVEVRAVRSPSHAIQVERERAIVRVKLAGGDTIPNKDLIVRYQVAGESTQTTLLTQADDPNGMGDMAGGGHFALYLLPAMQYRPEQVVPKDMVFLIDTSGSQAGAPLAQCQALMRRFMAGLNPDDTFAIIDFSDTTQQLSPVPLPNTAEHRSRALQYINQLSAGGGTEMLRGIRAVLNFPIVDPGRLRSIVLLTDGYIGNENQILAEVQRQLQSGNRLYSFGAGSSVNRFLLSRIAELGRGTARMIRHDEPIEQVTEQFFRQMNNPVLTNIQLRWEGDGEAPMFYPAPPPDVFADQPLVLFGRKGDRRPGTLSVTGVAAGGSLYEQRFEVSFDAPGNPGIAQLWGRARLKDLMKQLVSGDTKAGVAAVTETALRYRLLSQYTAFVAVSEDIRVDATEASVSVQVPVEMPDAVSYAGIFGGTTYSPAPPPMMAAPAAGAGMRQRARSAASPPVFDCQSQPPEVFAAPSPYPFNMTPIAPGAIGHPESDQPQQLGDRLQILSATGLSQTAIAELLQQLQQIALSAGISGTLVFEFHVTKGRLPLSNGRVKQLVLDEQASTLSDARAIERIRQHLLIWRSPQKVTGVVRLVIRIQAANG